MSDVSNKTASPSGASGQGLRGYFSGCLKKPVYHPPTLRKESFIEKHAHLLYIFMAFLIPFLLMFFSFKIMGVSPYGTKQVLVTDMWHQYYPFMVDYQAKLKAGESLLWTWTSGGGTNYVSLFAYYLASPLNFFSVFVPADSLREFFFVLLCVKIGLSGMFYSIFIRLTFGRKDISITAFGIMYALCAFIMGYYWNIIWLDSVALLPLVAAGTFALLRHGKFKLYIISLALSILANYYIGLFICAAVVLISVGYTIVNFKSVKKIVRDFFKMLGCSVVAVMITAILTLPAYFALGHAYSSSNSFPEKFAVNIGSTPDFAGVLEGISKTISNSVAFVQPTAKEGLPNVYTGIFIVFLAILFLFCSKIKLRERLVCGFLALFFLVSFVIRQLDYIWHGFHFPNMLPYRFSFLWSFLLIYMAFRVFMYIDYVKLGSVIAAIAGFFVYLYIAGVYIKDANVNLTTLFKPITDGDAEIDPVYLSGWMGMLMAAWILLYVLREQLPRIAVALCAVGIGIASMLFVLHVVDLLDPAVFKTEHTGSDGTAEATESNTLSTVLTVVFIIMIIAAAILLLSRLNENHVMLKSVLSAVLVLTALFEGLFSAVTGVRTVSVTDATSYPLGTTSTLECADYIREQEKDNVDIARAEVTRYHSLNDDALIGINGVSMFNSMVNMPITNYMEKFGICGWIASNRYTYMQSSPFTDLMLNIKYLIDPYYGKYIDRAHYDLVYVAQPAKNASVASQVMKNKYYLPMGFMVEEDLLKYSAHDPVGFINKVAQTTFTTDYVPVSEDPIDNQNNFFKLATGFDTDLYEPLKIDSATSANGDVTVTEDKTKYTFSSSDSNPTYDFTATATHNGTAIAYVTGTGVEDVNLYVNDNYIGHYGTKRPLIMTFGDVKQGDVIKAEPKVTNHSSGTITCDLAMLNDTAFENAYHQFSRSTLNAEVVSGTRLSGTINAAEDGLFYTSIPYITGWRAFVDGEEVEITPVGDAMLAFRLTAGEHTVDLRYMPEGFVTGIVVSVAGLLIFILMIVAVWQKKRLLPVWNNVTAKAREKLPTGKKAPAKTATVKKAPVKKSPIVSEYDADDDIPSDDDDFAPEMVEEPDDDPDPGEE